MRYTVVKTRGGVKTVPPLDTARERFVSRREERLRISSRIFLLERKIAADALVLLSAHSPVLLSILTDDILVDDDNHLSARLFPYSIEARIHRIFHFVVVVVVVQQPPPTRDASFSFLTLRRPRIFISGKVSSFLIALNS